MLRLLGILVTVLLAIGAAVVVWPQFFHLEQTFPFAQVVAARGVVLGAFLVLAVIALLLVLIRPLRGFAASVLIVALLGAGATGAIGAVRGFGGDTLPSPTDSSVRVLSWNTAGEAVPADVIARQILDQSADIVALPETTEAVGEQIAIMLREQGHPMWVHNVQYKPDVVDGPKSWQTTVLVSPDLGEYSVIESSEDGTSNTGSVPSVVLMPVDGSGPTIVAVHAVAPRVEEMGQWRSDLAWIADQCPQGDVILAGDFNATIDHMAPYGVDGGDMGYCRDAASRTGNGYSGTWPSSLPALLSAPIDHVMASSNWVPTGSLVLDDAAGSDHRGIVVQLEPANTAG
jgi:endonuclease/exonuclease/phosphatase (EEP) superfamily protein YafD